VGVGGKINGTDKLGRGIESYVDNLCEIRVAQKWLKFFCELAQKNKND